MPRGAIDIIEIALAQRRMKRETLALDAGVSLDSLNKCMQGRRPFSLKMLVPISAVLGVEFDELRGSFAAPAVASELLGGYARASTRWLETRYLAVRYAFQREGIILAAAITIRWDDEESCLVHQHSYDFSGPVTKRGQVSVSSQSGHISLIASDLGRFELAILGRPTEDGRLQGIITMLYHSRGMQTPGASPIVLMPVAGGTDNPLPLCGEIEAGHPSFSKYGRILDMAEMQGFAKLARLQETKASNFLQITQSSPNNSGDD